MNKRKGRILTLLFFVVICTVCMALTACQNSPDNDKPKDEHVHEWVENVSAEYLAQEANCLSPATFYKSCSICGAKSEETFEFGEPNKNHIFAKDWSYDQESHWKDSTCGHSVTTDEGAHTFAEVVKDEFKLYDGDCGTPAIYIKSCSVCGYHKDTQRPDENDIFTFGEPTGKHNFIENDSSSYLKSEASCTAPKTYYKSCSVCGERSEETFTIGNALPHDFSTRDTAEKYLKSPATCTSPAIYYKSCSTCGASAANDDYTFEYGEELGHDFSDGGNCPRCGALPYEFRMKLSDDGEHYIVDGVNYCYADEVTIPSTYNGKPVTELGTGTRFYLYHPKTVTIPETITKINSSIVFSDSVTVNWNSAAFPSIPESALLMCVETLNLGPDVKTLPYAFTGIKHFTAIALEETAESALSRCPDLESADLGGSLIKIGRYTFGGCSKLANISLCNNLKEIEANAFQNCSSLTSVTIPKSVTLVGESAFEGCTGLTEVVFEDVPVATPQLTISTHAFKNCSNITTLTLGKTVKSLESAFYECTSLKTVVIPESLCQISENAFDYARELTTIYWNATNCETTDGSLPVFNGCPKVSHLIIGDNVKVIPNRAFYNLIGIKSVIIPESVTSIGAAAFERCTALLDVEIKANLTRIPNSAFAECSALSGITLPKSVTSIGSYAFGASGLTQCIIPENVTSISDDAFQGCSKITSVIWNATNYTATYNYSDFFSWMSTITSVTIGENVISIPYNLFRQCSSLTTVNIGANVENIGERAFGEVNLTEISLPASLKSIGTGAFNASMLRTIKFAGSMQEWKDLITASSWSPSSDCKIICTDGTTTGA